MKDRLVRIFNLMQEIQTSGVSTLKIADCMRELADIINNMPDESQPNELAKE